MHEVPVRFAFALVGSISTLGIQRLWSHFHNALKKDAIDRYGPHWRG